ncbi:hypothetical protein Pla22_02310 [Rubripirellula amarantea]|uniref:Uncharacterized protein n=1 Tax=Rubripirellula amarantea TaxID=2527999 RepID=A0A5C5WPW1_9BACT|nr:hypothetical protein [Rubripirellula amarantea]TWT52607.1 hypothetical protein Pla22_02310 [Rubripirellula amarantea]
MNRFLLSAVAFVTLTFSTVQVHSVQAGGCLGDQCNKVCCPKCDCKCYTCNLDAKVVDAEKQCFEVEHDVICIPKVVFPWQRGKKGCNRCDSCDGSGCSACHHNGAKIRKVKKLKTKKYTCPECEYTWTAKETGPVCSSGGNCGCGVSSCDGGCDGMTYSESYSIPQPLPALEAAPQYQATPYQASPYQAAPYQAPESNNYSEELPSPNQQSSLMSVEVDTL